MSSPFYFHFSLLLFSLSSLLLWPRKFGNMGSNCTFGPLAHLHYHATEFWQKCRPLSTSLDYREIFRFKLTSSLVSYTPLELEIWWTNMIPNTDQNNYHRNDQRSYCMSTLSAFFGSAQNMNKGTNEECQKFKLKKLCRIFSSKSFLCLFLAVTEAYLLLKNQNR